MASRRDTAQPLFVSGDGAFLLGAVVVPGAPWDKGSQGGRRPRGAGPGPWRWSALSDGSSEHRAERPRAVRPSGQHSQQMGIPYSSAARPGADFLPPEP